MTMPVRTGCSAERATEAARPRALRRGAARRGFTLVELMVVVTIVGLLCLLGFPRIAAYNGELNVRAARDLLEQQLSIARAGAIQHNRVTQLNASANAISVTSTDSTGATTTMVKSVALDSAFGVTLRTTAGVVAYNSRGRATGLTGVQQYTVSGFGLRDSLCISALGADLGRSCAQ